MKNTLPAIGIMMGDRHGIGPEITARFLADERLADCGRAVLFADPLVADFGRKIAGVDRLRLERFAECVAESGETPGMGRATAGAGAEVLATWNVMLRAATSGEIDGIVYAPVNKDALHKGGMREIDDLAYAMKKIAFHGDANWLYVLDGLWMSRITGHVALKDVSALITKDSVFASITLLHKTLVSAGKPKPKIAVAGLNPHSGDGGAYGDEEIKAIGPAIETAKSMALDVDGPIPPDTVFVQVSKHGYDGVVTMYHDQGGIAMKLMGFGRGVAVMGGLPFPIVTVGHGTAYDIVGKGVAQSDGMLEAFRVCCRIAGS